MTRRIDPDTLLANAGWVRALALRLVHDEAGADDVVQDTLTAAVARPPQGSVPLAAWLAHVARNFSLRLLRSGRRRRAREALRVRTEPAPSVEESAARTEMFHDVVAAVLALEPRYRDVVVQRFFEGLDLRHVAERLGIPRETARTRLRRALALLRTRLDTKYGVRRTWAVGLLPLGHLAQAAGAATAASTGHATTLGGTLMAASTKAVVGAALAGALLGGAVTLAVVPRTESSQPFERPGVSVADAGPGAQGGGSGAFDADSVPPGPRLEGTPGSAATLAGMLRPVRLDLPPAATGTITGHVTSKAGLPLAGVVVRAWLQRPRERGHRRARVPSLPSTEEQLQYALESASWDQATRRETRTDAEGAYVLRDLLDASYNLNAWADGMVLRPTRGSEWTARPGGTVDFHGETVVGLEVSVLMPDGSAAHEASVSWTVPKKGGGGGASWSSSDPVVEIEPGDWTITAEIRPDYRSEPLAMTVGEKPEPITLKLQGRNRLAGALRFDAADTGWAYAFIYARRRSAAASESPSRSDARPPDWSFRFEGLAAGEYDVSVALADGEPVASFVFDVEGAVLSQVLTIPRLTSAQFLEARVVGPGGSALDEDDVSFGLSERKVDGHSVMGARSARRPDGIFVVALASYDNTMRVRVAGQGGGGGGAPGRPAPPSLPATVRDDDPTIEHELVVTSKAHGRREVPYVPGRTSRVEVAFP